MNENSPNSNPYSDIFQILGYDKRDNPNKYLQLIILTFISIGMMLVSYIVFNNPISAFTLLLCSLALMLYYIQKPMAIKISLGKDDITIGNDTIPWSKIKVWDIMEGQTVSEVYIVSTTISNPNITFYLPRANFNNYNKFLDIMYEKANFQKGLSNKNNFQNILRIVGLK